MQHAPVVLYKFQGKGGGLGWGARGQLVAQLGKIQEYNPAHVDCRIPQRWMWLSTS